MLSYRTRLSRYDTNFQQHAIIMLCDINLSIRYMTFSLTVYDSMSSGNEKNMWRYFIQHQHIISKDGFIMCGYNNIIGSNIYI